MLGKASFNAIMVCLEESIFALKELLNLNLKETLPITVFKNLNPGLVYVVV